MMRSVLGKDTLAGLLLAVLGLLGVALSLGYPLGASGRMGPGFVPLMIASCLAALGVAVAAGGIIDGFRRPVTVSAGPAWNARPLISILGGILLFGLTIKTIGLIGASLLLLASASLAVKGQSIRQSLVLATCLIAAVSSIFVYGIGVRIALLPAAPVLPWN